MSPAVPSTDAAMYERVVEAILDHRLLPGTKLVEDKLAAAFGVSRTRVRPVLVRLANERIVTLTPNRGATVTRPDELEAREMFEVRRLVEPRLVELFIQRAGPADLQRLVDLQAEEMAARAAGDQRRALRLSGDFHLAIAAAAGHSTLERLLRELVSRTSLVLMAYGPRDAGLPTDASACGCREHQVLIDAIRLRDAAEATRRMRDHLAQLEERLVFQQEVDPEIDVAAMLAA